MSAATHVGRSYPVEQCSEAADYYYGTYHYIYIYGQQLLVFVEGNVSYSPFELKAGQRITVEMAFDWSREGIKRDFALTVWSDVEPLKITHHDGLESDHWPLIGTEED